MMQAAGRPVALAQGPRVQKGGIRRGEAIDWAQVGGFGEAEAILQGLVRAVDAAKGGLFLPDLQDETRASLVATHEASPGSCPVDFVAFEATDCSGVKIDHGRVWGSAWFARSRLDRHGLDATQCASYQPWTSAPRPCAISTIS